METRSRKRAEASSAAPSSPLAGSTSRATKRARLSASSPSNSKSAAASSSSSISTRLRSSRVQEPSSAVTPMDSTSESSRSRRRGRSLDKGKEKAHEVRIRDRDRNSVRSLGLDMDEVVGVDDEDNDSEGGVRILHPNLSAASSALQGLLRKFGAGFDDYLPSSAVVFASASHQSGQLKNILSGLRADGEEGRQVEALTQLCEMLSIGTEETLSTFSIGSFAPVLVLLLNHQSNPDIMLLAARAITHLCDVLPSSCAAVVHYGAVSSFCARLLTIEYMDLAEQSLQALKKISQEHPTACLRAGALMAVLSYLDFFSTGVQRVALSTAANICKKLPSDASDFVMDAVPLLTNLLQCHDAKVLEHTSVCLTLIAEAFASSPDKLDELCNRGLVTQAAALISTSNSGGQSSLSTPTYTGLIRLLSTCACWSHSGAKTLLLLGISGTLKDILSGSRNCANLSVSPALSRPPEQIREVVNLANELLPPLPHGTISLPANFSSVVKGFVVKNLSAPPEKQEGTNSSGPENSAREKLINDHPELLQQFGMDLLPILIQIHGSSVNGAVRYKCLSVIGKLMYFSTAEMIRSLLSVTNLSSFLASLLVWKDVHFLIPALQISEILMEKLPDIFSKMFVREGVVHAIDQLILASPPHHACSQISSALRDSESLPGTSSRTQRYRRRCGNPNSDGNVLEESKNIVSAKSSSPPGSMEVPYTDSNIRLAVSTCAQSLKDKYFPADPGALEVGVPDNLLHLKSLCMKVNVSCGVQMAKATTATEKSNPSGVHLIDSCTNEEYLSGLISEMLVELGKGDGISTFEFIGSGVVAALLNYFSCGNFLKEKILEANLPKLRQRALDRFKSFVAVALPATITEGTVAPMAILVQKLQDALSSLEHFPVLLCHSPGLSGGSARISSGLSALSQSLKLRVSRDHGEKGLRDYSSNVVLVDPLASLDAVEEFLWHRVQQGGSGAGQKHLSSTGNSDLGATPAATPSPSNSIPSIANCQSTRSMSSISTVYDTKKDPSEEKGTSSSKGKGKAILKPAQEEPSGPQTRNAVRRKAAFDKDVEMKPVDGDSAYEDEELDAASAEIDDALVIEEDDFSDDEDDEDYEHDDVFTDDPDPVCMPNKVHDVRLSDVAENDNIVSGRSDSQINPAGSSGRTAAVGGLDSADHKNENSYGFRGAMSFADAARAALGSVNGRGSNKEGLDHKGRLFGSSGDPPKLIFFAGGKQLSRHSTIYQAMHQQLVLHGDDDERYAVNDLISNDGSRLWNDTFTITYRRAETQANRESVGVSSSTTFEATKSGSSSSLNFDFQLHHISLLDCILLAELPSDLDKSHPTYSILALLRVLEGLNRLAISLRAQIVSDQFAGGKVTTIDGLSDTGARVPPDKFINSKLTPKLARQIQDALALCSGLPSWCYQLTKACPFLFPFEVRRQFFYSTAFGPSRALFRLQQQQGADSLGFANGREMRVERLQRQKVRVSRNRILDSALKVMEMYCSQKTILEVEYFGEVGTGLGPTLEFYTLLSHDLQRAGLGMWRLNFSDKPSMEIDGDDQNGGKANSGPRLDPAGGNVELIQASLGLFPRPWPPSADASDGSQFSKVIEYFRLVGRVMAKALQDGRLLDLPMSAAFFKLMLGQELDLQDILSFDSEIGKTFQELWALVCRKQYLESTNCDNRDAIDNLYFHGCPVEDLCLDFTLPGYPDYILKPGDKNVDIYNLEEYLSLVVDATVKTGIMRQIEAFKAGFNQVFDIACLQIFTPNELDYLLCGRRELWESESLADHIKFDHGYTAKSPAIANLLEIMGDFTPQQQRAFCQFVTGAPKLPPGGLAVLNPKLTIVRKHSSTATNGAADGTGCAELVDNDLPSVMTCANYLKLPPYSTKEIMFKKLMYAISEGQGSFDLS